MTPSLWLRLGWICKIRKEGRGWIYAMSEASSRSDRPDRKHPEYFQRLLEKMAKEQSPPIQGVEPLPGE
jgi:hypothetical protein